MSLQTNSLRYCLYCGTEIIGRSDKRFCDDSCRNNYHYHIKAKSDSAIMIKRVNAQLLNNREILKSLCIGNRIVIEKKLLDDNLFDFELITNLYKAKNGAVYRVVYDYAYKMLNDGNVQLLRFMK